MEVVNFRRRLFLVFTFALVLRACCLKLNVRSSATSTCRMQLTGLQMLHLAVFGVLGQVEELTGT